MSFLNKKWKILNEDKNLPLIKRLLINRGITNETEEENFFSNNYSFHDPFLFKDMDKAVERIAKAIKNNERIMIFGDYDVDGISGSAILIHTLRKLNANVSYRLPSRQKDGYGLQNHFIEEFKNLKVKLVITVDNGIACKEPIDLAKSLDIDVIVTDHHGLPENFPDQAYAIIHPRQQDCQYPFKDLAGAGVAFKLAQALLKSLKIKEAEDFIEDLFDLACLGTIADCTSLTHENRAIVKKGLKKLQNSKWKGLNLIKKKAGIESMTDNDTYVVGFKIGPRINAAGRIDNPYYALQALLDENGKAEKFVNKLEQLNSQRQQITDKALKYLEANFEDVLKNEDICILNHKDWPSGIIGLLAGKISEKYGKPAFIMEDRGGILIGSVRCPEYFDAFEAITHTKQYLEHFGGHQQAAGYSIKKENLAQFTQALKTFAKEKIAGKDTNPILEIDTIIDAKNLNLETVALINTFAPYGVGNKKPMFILENVNLQNLKKVGSEGKHLSLNTVCQNQVIKSIAFSFGQFFEKITSDKHYNIVCHLSSNKWNNYEKLELQIIDLT